MLIFTRRAMHPFENHPCSGSAGERSQPTSGKKELETVKKRSRCCELCGGATDNGATNMGIYLFSDK